MQLDKNTLRLIKKACNGKKHIKLSIGFISNDIKTVKVFGENSEIQDENYLYEIASITKTFTASLMAKYIHENRMSLDDSIQKYFDGLHDDKYYPTLKRLATHTAGYSMNLPFTWRDFLSVPIKGYPPLQNVDRLKMLLQKNPRKEKDYRWIYSNYGFTLIGHAVGVISGKGYWDTMDDFLLNELGLKNSFTGICSKRNLHGFNKKNIDCGNYDKFEKVPEIPAGEGDISATAEDLLRYAQINMDEEKPYLPLCHKRHANVSSMLATVLRRVIGVKEFDMGLGWMLNKDNNNILWHGGDSDYFSSYLVIDKDNKLAAVVLSNYKMNTLEIGLSVLEYLQNKGTSKNPS